MAPNAASRSPMPPSLRYTPCHLGFKVRDALAEAPFQVMEDLEPEASLQINFEAGNIFVVQRLEGHWCIMTLVKGRFDLEGLEPPAPAAKGMDEFFAVRVIIQPWHAAPTVTFISFAPSEQDKVRGIELAKNYPLAKVPANVSNLRLRLSASSPDLRAEVRWLRHILTRPSSAALTLPPHLRLSSIIPHSTSQGNTSEPQEKIIPAGPSSSSAPVKPPGPAPPTPTASASPAAPVPSASPSASANPATAHCPPDAEQTACDQAMAEEIKNILHEFLQRSGGKGTVTRDGA